MRVFGLILAAFVLGGCVSPPKDLADRPITETVYEGHKFEVRHDNLRAYSQIVGGPMVSFLNLAEASDLHRGAVRKVTNCEAVNQVLPDIGRMVTDLQC